MERKRSPEREQRFGFSYRFILSIFLLQRLGNVTGVRGVQDGVLLYDGSGLVNPLGDLRSANRVVAGEPRVWRIGLIRTPGQQLAHRLILRRQNHKRLFAGKIIQRRHYTTS